MRVVLPKEPLWTQVVSPILWPVLMAQLLLVVLGVAITLICWWLMPAEASWSLTFWLLLALLVGSSLNVAIFLMLLRQRLYRHTQELAARLDSLDRALDQTVEPAEDQRAATRSPQDRIDHLVTRLGGPASRDQGELARARQAEQRLSDELESLQSRMGRLETERERARESARLKSHYLAHLQQTLMPSLEALEQQMPTETSCPELVGKLRSQLADARSLLDTLDESPDAAQDPSACVLIVDDGPVNLMLARQVLEREGLQVVTASCGSEALERLSEWPIDLVFMDIFMADMDGVETCRIWRGREAAGPGTGRNVVIALTANAGEADRRRFEEAGMDDYLAKPYRPQDILETVRHWLPGVLQDGKEPS